MSDRGLHNRGEFSKELSSMGQITQIGVESPEQLGRTERHGGLLKAMVIRVIAELQLVGREVIQHVLTQSVDDQEQYVKGKRICTQANGYLEDYPRKQHPSWDEENWADLGALTAAEDPTLEFGQIAKIREKARKAFVRADMSSRVRRAILRKSAPITKEYGVGDLVCFRTDQLGWSTVSRIIGFDGPKVFWVLCKGTPACVALDRLRPVNASEAPAYQYLVGQKPFVFGSGQQGYVDVEKELPTVHEEEQEEDSESDGEYTPSIAPQQERLPQGVPIESDEDDEMSRETAGERE